MLKMLKWFSKWIYIVTLASVRLKWHKGGGVDQKMCFKTVGTLKPNN